MKSIKLALNYMQTKKSKYLMAFFSIGMAAILMLINPLIIKITIDSIIGDAPLNLPAPILNIFGDYLSNDNLINQLWLPAVLILLVTVLRGVFLYLKGKWAAEGAEEFARNLRNELFEHLQYLDFNYHLRKDTGDLIQRSTSDLDTIRRFLSIQLVEVGRAFFMLSTVLIIMLSLDLYMTIISMMVVPIIFIFAYIFFKKVKVAFKASDEAEARLSTVIQENLTGVRVVKAFAKQPYEKVKFDQKNKEHKDLTFHLIKLLAYYWSFSDLICFVQIGIVLIAGSFRAASGQLTLGSMVVFTTYIGMLLWPVRQTGRILTDMGKAEIAFDRINEILAEPRENYRGYGYDRELTGNIEVNNLSFAYENELVLDDISFEIKSGEKLGILGTTGSGKSTLAYILTRLLDYKEGSIKIDGIELKEYDRGLIREQIGLILQEPFLFAKTIKENIVIGAKDNEKLIKPSVEVAQFDKVIENFKDEYETEVGEKGVSLSGGQKQRLAIARTLIKNSPIIIFDDSLSAVDTKTDFLIRKSLSERYGDKTMIIISHRIDTLADTDQVIVMDKGKIVQKGRHENLISESGLYNRTWKIQSQTEID
ncbi:ABC transporter ATP-binding protein [Halanaerobiaceae bacterium Z-7014]|uniref:ABC transporter ATP-binding protein n=1 Tax=Halonatronomonas betaini TaxID=2778430 RepID=A0A931ASZ5_9FIRM|nr:ABC transporter ATP-binding protein [Halonatronomonas betaini]MBF8435920.1 ABC transporter ATP-binding protein [Halonatronomonas betaini]